LGIFILSVTGLKENMIRMGTIKMGGMIGLYIGPIHTATSLIFVSILTIILIIVMRNSNAGRIPFGPVLAFFTLFVLLINFQF